MGRLGARDDFFLEVCIDDLSILIDYSSFEYISIFPIVARIGDPNGALNGAHRSHVPLILPAMDTKPAKDTLPLPLCIFSVG